MRMGRAALFLLYLNIAFSLLWTSACFTPGWLNVPLGLKMSAEEGVGGNGEVLRTKAHAYALCSVLPDPSFHLQHDICMENPCDFWNRAKQTEMVYLR